MYVLRTDFGTRVAGEKAQYKDEFLTRSQIKPGQNVVFTYDRNTYDIIINARAGDGGGAVEGLRTLQCNIKLQVLPKYQSDPGAHNFGSTHKAYQGGNSTYERYYGTVYYIDVCHNWNLRDKKLLNYSIIEMWPDCIRGHSYPNVIPVDENRVRVWGTVRPQSSPPNAYKNWIVTTHTGTSNDGSLSVGDYITLENTSIVYKVVSKTNVSGTYVYVLDRTNGLYTPLSGDYDFEKGGGGSISISFSSNSESRNVDVGKHGTSEDWYLYSRTIGYTLSLVEITGN